MTGHGNIHRSDDPTASQEDASLYCPNCEYNLTGLPEDRCPECGEAFDREQLLLQAAGGVGPIPGWDDDSDASLWSRYWRTCRLVMGHPVLFARRFPAMWPYASSQAIYRGTQLVLVTIVAGACLSILMGGLIYGHFEVIATGILSCLLILPLLMGIWWAEWFVALLLERKTRLKKEPLQSNSPRIIWAWWDFIGYYALIHAPATFLIMVMVALGAFNPLQDWLMIAFVGIPMISYSCWCAMIIGAVHMRAQNQPGRLTALFLIFPIGLAGTLFGWLLSGLVIVSVAPPLVALLMLLQFL